MVPTPCGSTMYAFGLGFERLTKKVSFGSLSVSQAPWIGTVCVATPTATLLRLVRPTPAARPSATRTASAKLTARKTLTRLPSSSFLILLIVKPRSVVVLDRPDRLAVAEVGVRAQVKQVHEEGLVWLLQ